jgi:hypothetical protein
MGHLIEEYAKSLGVKIGKPVLVDHYYPTLHDKYITIHTDDKIDSKNYEYFPQVINLLKPFLLQNGYKIYQIGGPQDPKLSNVDGSFLNLTYKQSCFLIKNSKLHIGIDSLPIHIASTFDIPIIALYSHIYPSNAYPYWSTKENVCILEADRNGNKPSFGYQESPKTIRTIKPENIATAALKLLNINNTIAFNTLSIGNHYHIPLVEVVPNFRANLQDQKDKTLYIRADLHFDDQNIAFWCSNYKVKIITDKMLPLDLLTHFSSKIEQVFFKLKDSDIPTDYFEQVRKAKINFIICTTDKENLAKIRNNFFDFRVEFDDVNERCINVEKINCKFLTNKILISNSQLYASEAHLKIDKKLDIINKTIHDDDAFWKDSEHYYLYE